MKKTLTYFALMALALVVGMIATVVLDNTGAHANAKDEKVILLSHDVYFTLADPTTENKNRLVAACHKYLTGHEGTVFYAAGTLAEDLDRPVNDRNFHVALHLVFKDKAAHDLYADHPRHLEFIEQNKALWESVRVFDSYVQQ